MGISYCLYVNKKISEGILKKVQILLSLYNPNQDYLIKQLDSINHQTCQDLEVLIFDDGHFKYPVDRTLIQSHLNQVSYSFLPPQDKNLGYEKAFETLIQKSTADILAFCDQDDIWMPNKIEKCVRQLEQDQSLAVVSDKSIIDSKDTIVIESVKQQSSRYFDRWETGDDIAKYDLFICYAVGMSMVVDGDFARKSMPISRYTAHDKWLLACAASEGSVSYINEPLVLYRRHGNNVSGTLMDVHSKKDYYTNRILRRKGLLDDFFKKYPNHKDKEEVMAFMKAQLDGDIKGIKQYAYLAPDIAKFDIVYSILPDFLFRLFLILLKKRV